MRLLRVAKNNSEFRDFLLTCGPQTLSFPYTSNYRDDRFPMEMDFQRPITAGAAAYCYYEKHWKFRVFSIDLWASNFIVSDMYGSYLLGPYLLLEKKLGKPYLSLWMHSWNDSRSQNLKLVTLQSDKLPGSLSVLLGSFPPIVRCEYFAWNGSSRFLDICIYGACSGRFSQFRLYKIAHTEPSLIY